MKRNTKVDLGGRMSLITHKIYPNAIYDVNYNKLIQENFTSYTGMFFDDFCSSFSSHLSETMSSSGFYSFTGDKDKFNNTFGYDFLDYEFDHLLSNVAKNMLLFGKAYVAKEEVYNKKEKTKQIDYWCMNCKKIKRIGPNLYYKCEDYNGSTQKGKINQNDILIFDIKNINLIEKHLLKKLNKLDKNSNASDICLKYDNFDFHYFKRKEEEQQLILTKNIFWNCRNSSNYYVSEPYLLYRLIKFSILQENLLQYMVSVFNTDLTDSMIKGEITYNSKVKGYDKLIDDLLSGKKNCKEVGDIYFRFR